MIKKKNKKKDREKRKEQVIRANLNFEVFNAEGKKIGYFEDGEWHSNSKYSNNWEVEEINESK